MADAGARPIVNALTVDVEDYFQVSAFDAVVRREDWPTFERRVARNTDRLLAIFDDAGVKATFFILGWVADCEPELVKRIAAAGHEVASHGFAHQLIYQQSPSEFRDDVRRSRGALQALAGQPVVGYRAPSFSVTAQSLWALDVLQEEGYEYDASIFPIRHDRYGISSAPRHAFRLGRNVGQGFSLAGGAGLPVDGPAPVGEDTERGLFEVPASTVRLAGMNLPIAGGGYFRLLPYAWCRWGLRRVNQVEGKPAVFYLHPWEIDPEQPRFPAGWLSRFRHYRHLSETETRLRRLLSEFRFGPIEEAILAPALAAA